MAINTGIATLALVRDTFREAFARKIFWGFFGCSTAVILFLIFLMKIDVVEGALATISLFGNESRAVEVTKLEKELKRLLGEKPELERQFNDVNVVRAQVAKLREEMNIARRLEWMRSGLLASSDQKGAQKLMQGINPASPTTTTGKAAHRPNYDLNVEVTADGSVRVIPPPSTNSPAAR